MLCVLACASTGSVAQKAVGIDDTVEDFRGDVLASCGALVHPPLVEVLVNGATKADGFLRSMGIELDAVSQLGGHTVARTHRFAAKEGKNPPPVGFGIMTALEKLLRTTFAEGTLQLAVHLYCLIGFACECDAHCVAL